MKAIQSQLPAQTTIIRYFFAGKSLLAFVMDQQQKQLIRLPANGLEKDIVSLSNPALGVKQTSDILYILYQQLWAPLAKSIRYNTVVIIPDGILLT